MRRRLEWLVLVLVAGFVGTASAAFGWVSQDSALTVDAGYSPEPNAALWQLILIPALLALTSVVVVVALLVRGDLPRDLAVATAAILIAAVGFWLLGNDDERFPIDESLRYSDAKQLLIEHAEVAVGAAGIDVRGLEVLETSSADQDESVSDRCRSEYGNATGSSTLRVLFRLPPSVDGGALAREAAALGYMEFDGYLESLYLMAYAYSSGMSPEGEFRFSLRTPCLPNSVINATN